MTFDEIRQEVKDHGLDHLSDTRINRLINLAYRRTYNKELWPWRLTEISLAAPASITGTIRQVKASDGYALDKQTAENLENNGIAITEAGTPTAWYLDADRRVATYPSSTDTLTIRYYARVEDLVDGETPDIPDEYHYLLVLDAVRRGKTENGEPEAAIQYANDYNELFADLKRDAFNGDVAGALRLNDLHEGM